MTAKRNKADAASELNALLRQMLGEAADIKLLEKFPNKKELIDAMAEGNAAPKVREMLVRKIVALAVDPTKPRENRWASELVWDRMEGKAAQADRPTDDGSAVEARLAESTRAHLEELAQAHVPQDQT
jgi:AcrR family transcriptional regulator